MAGWIKLYRKLLDDPLVNKDPDHFAVWIYLLLEATHADMKRDFNGQIITLNPGQLITGRKTIAKQFDISETKVQRILKSFENGQQIEQQTTGRGRLITIINWNKYQASEQQNEQQVNNKRTTSEQQVNTNKNIRIKELKNSIYIGEKTDPKKDQEKTKKNMIVWGMENPKQPHETLVDYSKRYKSYLAEEEKA